MPTGPLQAVRFWLILALLGSIALLPLSAEPKLLVEKSIDGQAYINLKSLADYFGMRSSWFEGGKQFRLKSEWTTLDFEVNNRLMRINGLPVYLGFLPKKSSDALYLSQSDFHQVLQPIMTPQVFEGRPQYRRIVIDPGHGGNDSGARNEDYGLEEKMLTLDVAKRLKVLLEPVGFEVFLTRDTDVYVPLERRAEIANQIRADLFISLHFNAAASTTAEGFESFALTPQGQSSTRSASLSAGDVVKYRGNAMDPWNMLLSYYLQEALVDGLGGTNRGLKRARFAVLKDLNCPGVLTELGFLTHSRTAEKISLDSHRERLAQTLYNGIVGYANRLKRLK
jgi:N-acetylmuramoyl-L-alanine amidase